MHSWIRIVRSWCWYVAKRASVGGAGLQVDHCKLERVLGQGIPDQHESLGCTPAGCIPVGRIADDCRGAGSSA